MAAASTSVESFGQSLLSNEEQSWLRTREQTGYLGLRLTPVNEPRDDLGRWLDQAVEQELQTCGACRRPSYVGLQPASVLPDQLYRARMLGYTGLAVLLPSLKAFADDGLLSGANSQALHEWRHHAQMHGVVTRFSDQDTDLRLFPAPVSFAEWLPEAPSVFTSRPAETSACKPSQDREHTADPTEEETRPSKPIIRSLRSAMRSALSESPAEPLAASPSPSPAAEPFTAEPLTVEPSPAELVAAVTPPPVHPAPASAPTEHASTMAVAPEALELDDLVGPSPEHEERLAMQPKPPAAAVAKAASPAQPMISSRTPSSAVEVALADDSRAATKHASANSVAVAVVAAPSSAPQLAQPAAELLLENLQATDGSRAWSEIEQLFLNSYVPLQQALEAGTAPAGTKQVLTSWALDFSQSYERAFEAMRTRQGKRPRLVLDAPGHAFQLSRQAETEHAKLVLVDGLRADLASVVREKLRLQLLNSAECVEQGLMWAALPATTSTQMELIARGTDGLRHFSGALSEDQLMSSGNDLRRLRPVRVGTHRMYKLDIVAHLTRDLESLTVDKLQQCAAEVATSVGRFIRQQPADTLVYVFGDHGFGGEHAASPERVLVPYLAWRVNTGSAK